MAPRTMPPFRADHVGSLLRPAALHRAREDAAAGRIDGDALRTVEDDAIREAVRMQEDGLLAVTDGEFRRATWHLDFIYALDGISTADDKVKISFTTSRATSSSWPRRCTSTGGSACRRRSSATPSRFCRSAPTAPSKLTIPSPSMVHYRGGRAAIDETVYPELEEFWDDLTAAYREEVRRLGDRLPYLQLDDTSLAYPERPGATPVRLLDRWRPGRTARRVHPAHQRGAPRPSRGDERHDAHVPRELPVVVGGRGRYEHVAEALFHDLEVDGYFWSGTTSARAASSRFASSRRPEAGRARPRDDEARRARVEGRAEAADRGGEPPRLLDQLYLSPQCGFSSTVEGNALGPEERGRSSR